MASSVLFEEQFEVPYCSSLAEFRAWALSDDFPQHGRIDYIKGRIEVDMSPENVFFHGSIKTEVVGVLASIVKSAGGGYLFTDQMRVSSPAADLSAEPDVVYMSDETIDSGRVRSVPSASGEPDSYVELEGAPDLVVEIVSDNSVAKDTKRLPISYWCAGIAEYWLIDVRGERLVYRIHCAEEMGTSVWRRTRRSSSVPRSSIIASASAVAATPAEDGYLIYSRGSEINEQLTN